MIKHIISLLAVGFMAHADIIPGSLPILTPFTSGLTEVTYHLALTTQTITPGSEFVILDVSGFDHWATPSDDFSLTVEFTTSSVTAYDDPLKENLRFTYLNLEALTGPVVLTPLSGFIFEESEELTLRSEKFATHGYQLEADEILPTHRVSRHAAVPEASTWMAAVALAGLALIQRRR